MRKLLLLIGLAFVFNHSFAQYALPKGKAQLNGGIGLSLWGIHVYVGGDYHVHKNLAIGGEISYPSYLLAASKTQ